MNLLGCQYPHARRALTRGDHWSRMMGDYGIARSEIATWPYSGTDDRAWVYTEATLDR